MGFAEHFKAGPPQKKVNCAVSEIINNLRLTKRSDDADGLEQIIQAIRANRNAGLPNHNNWNAMNLHRIMRSEGIEVSRATLERHINLICSCKD